MSRALRVYVAGPVPFVSVARGVAYALPGASCTSRECRCPLKAPNFWALGALALVGCVQPLVTYDDATEPTPPPVVYQATAEQREEPYVHELAPEARCDDGDVVIGGGCSWGKRRDPERSYPVEVVQSRPSDDGEGWLCVGRRHGVGVEFELVTAYAICLVVEP